MKRRLTKGLFAMSIALAALSSQARADFSLEIVTGMTDIVVTDGGPLDLNSTAGRISVDVSTLNALLDAGNAGFNFNVLGGSSNSLTPGAGTVANLLQNGTVVRTDNGTGSDPLTITIIATENAFTSPLGAGRVLTSSAADTFLSFASSDNRTFRSRFSDNNGTITSSTLLFGASPSSNGNSPNVGIPGASSGTFSLTSTTVVTLGPVDSTDQFSGTTTVRAVPEPASASLILLGGASVAFGYRRRHARRASR